jgi:Calcineurin-like phosphoesterase
MSDVSGGGTDTTRRKLVAFMFMLVCAIAAAAQSATSPEPKLPAATPLPEGSWRFIVSGDSRNCGDIVMPAIAAHSTRYAPSFYWHLGDLRAIYKIDEDMAFAAQNKGEVLSCDNYQRRAWNDFVENQIAPFGNVPFYVGIGNHEVIPPKNEDAFKRHFYDWLNLPALQKYRQLDREPLLPEAYFHWIQGGVDFIYLDNASNFFSNDEQTWLIRRLQSATSNSEVKSVVVGMHEVLPDSIANYHSMGDNTTEPRARPSGENVYKALVAFRDQSKKPVYVLASHSHSYMENIFDTAKLKEKGPKPLSGWIVGTAGAVRYPLPAGAPPTAKTDVYGYVLATVSADGTIQFTFEEVRESDVPQYVQQRYPATAVPWCFAHNSMNREPTAADITPRCIATNATATPTSAPPH